MTPTSEDELARMISDANAPLQIKGGGTRGVLGDGPHLETTGIAGIELYEPGALTLVAKAGTPVAEVEEVLRSERQRLAFEPMDHRSLLGRDGTPTIGGVAAANISGPRRIQSGACRDFMLGVRFVDGNGTVLKNGGRVMKNVTGYDLVKLMAGSFGTLGVLTEIAFKVLPVPETEVSLVVHGANLPDAVRAMSAALGSPYEVTGAAYAPDQGVILRLEGFEASVTYRATALTGKLAGFGEITLLGAEESAQTWMALRDVTALADKPGDVWRISIKPGDAPELVARLGEQAQVQIDWGGGLLWALVAQGTDLRARLGTYDGHATLVRADADTLSHIPRFEPEAPAMAALSAALRGKFDPRGLFSPALAEA